MFVFHTWTEVNPTFMYQTAILSSEVSNTCPERNEETLPPMVQSMWNTMPLEPWRQRETKKIR